MPVIPWAQRQYSGTLYGEEPEEKKKEKKEHPPPPGYDSWADAEAGITSNERRGYPANYPSWLPQRSLTDMILSGINPSRGLVAGVASRVVKGAAKGASVAKEVSAVKAAKAQADILAQLEAAEAAARGVRPPNWYQTALGTPGSLYNAVNNLPTWARWGIKAGVPIGGLAAYTALASQDPNQPRVQSSMMGDPWSDPTGYTPLTDPTSPFYDPTGAQPGTQPGAEPTGAGGVPDPGAEDGDRPKIIDIDGFKFWYDPTTDLWQPIGGPPTTKEPLEPEPGKRTDMTAQELMDWYQKQQEAAKIKDEADRQARLDELRQQYLNQQAEYAQQLAAQQELARQEAERRKQEIEQQDRLRQEAAMREAARAQAAMYAAEPYKYWAQMGTPTPEAVARLTQGRVAPGAPFQQGAGLGQPSAQWWNNLLPSEQEQILGGASWLGANPQDWFSAYQRMIPGLGARQISTQYNR